MLRYLETFFRNRWLITLPALLLLFAGSSLVLMVPPVFQAGAIVWIEELPYFDLPRPRNYWMSPAEIEAGRLKELVQTYTFARNIVDRTPIGASGTEEDKLELVDQIHGNLWIYNLGDNSLQIQFPHTDSSIALAVVQQTLKEYTHVTAERAKLQSEEAIAFYRQRIREYETTIIPETAKAVTDYLAAHPELGEGGSDRVDPNFALIQQQASTARDDLRRYQQQLDSVLTQSGAVSRNQMIGFQVLDSPRITHAGMISKKMLLLYAGIGVALATGYVALYLFLATELDRTMRNPNDVRRRLGLTVLTVIPDYTRRSETKQRKWAFRRKRQMSIAPAGSGSAG